jgi:chromosome segregation ATPase
VFKFILFVLINSSFVQASEGLNQSLLDLRAELQSEADIFETQRTRLSSSLQSEAIKKGELEADIERLEFKRKELQKGLSEKKNIVGGQDLTEFLGQEQTIESSLDQLKNYIQSSSPFKVKERIVDIKKLKQDKAEKKVTSAEYLSRYWKILQREIRLSESIEIHKSLITLNNEQVQVEILKIGAFQSYFLSPEGLAGFFKYNKKDNTWTAYEFKDSKSSTLVKKLYSARKKQIKDGVLELPLPTFFTKGGKSV